MSTESESGSGSKDTQITLIGTELAEAGTEFIYQGETEACEGCSHRNNCLNLDEGVRYRVMDVREGGQELDCAIHDGKAVRAVEVAESPVLAQVESKKAFEGSNVTIEEDACDKKDCPAYKFCVPDGFDFGEDYKINEVVGDNPVDCHYDKSLQLVELDKE
ncbi:MAG: UPF0179 family protein [Halobacteria archaeon]|nr:UPF0179 family protein [Halobacteria archaeon]